MRALRRSRCARGLRPRMAGARWPRGGARRRRRRTPARPYARQRGGKGPPSARARSSREGGARGMLTSGRTVAAERVRRRRRRGELGGGAAELGVSARASEAARARAGGRGRLFKARANLGTRDLRGSRGGGGAAVAPVRFGRSSGMTGGSHLRGPPVSGRQRQKGQGALRLGRCWAVRERGRRAGRWAEGGGKPAQEEE